MIAAILNLQIGARPRPEARNQMVRGLAHRLDVGHLNARRLASSQRAIGGPIELFGIADHVIDLSHGRKFIRRDLRAAARHHDRGVRALASRLADRLAGLAQRLTRHRATVDDERILELRARRQLADGLALIGVQPASRR